jgi:uncharacterized protein DUF4157/L,D-transpeptidase-like protein
VQSPGKRTLVQLQHDGAAPGPHKPVDVEAEAARGTSGSAQPYPHRAEIEASLGRSVPARAFFGAEASAACATLGVEAYTVGDSVAFATSNPPRRLAAHEAAHVVQQSGGVNLSGGDGSAGDPLEQHADAVAERVVAGQPAGDLLMRHGASHLPAVPQRKRVQRKVPDHAVTSADLSTRGGEQHTGDLTDKQVKDAIAWNDKQWTGKQRQELRTFLAHKQADEGGFTEDDVRAARQLQLGAGVEPAKADGMIEDTTMAILLQAGLTLGFEGGKAKAQDVQLLFIPGEFEDVAQWQAAVTQAVKDNPQAPYRAINEPSGTGRVYVKVKGNIVDVVNARGGPAVTVKDFGGHTADPTTAGTWTLGTGKSVVTASWDNSQIPWAAEVRKRADGEWEFKDPDTSKWKIATGSKSQLATPLKGSAFETENKGRDTWRVNDFGEMGWRIRGTDGQFIHTSPDDEATALAGSSPELSASHGCVHLDPAGRNRLRDRGYLQAGVTFVVRKYTVHLLPEAMRQIMQGDRPLHDTP